MKARLSLTLVLLPFIVLSFLGLGPFLESRSYSTPRAMVHLIEVGEAAGSCSGVAIAPTHVLTAAHCVSNPDVKITVSGKEAKILKVDEEQDLALLEVDVGCPCATLAPSSPEVDEKVIVVGWPLGRAETVTEGRSQGLVQPMEGIVMLSTTANVVFGTSGGGLFTFNGYQWVLAGLVMGVEGTTVGFMAIPVFDMSLMVPVENIRKFINWQ